MRLRVVAFTLVMAALGAAEALAVSPWEPIQGTWNFVPAPAYATVQLEVRYGAHDTRLDVPLAELGLSTWGVSQPMHAASFRMAGDAGRIDFTGTLGGGLAVGQFTFVPSRSYARRVARDGIRVGSSLDEFRALLLGISVAYVRAMTAVEPGLSMRDLLAFKELHIDAAFVGRLRREGYAHPTPREIIRLKALHP